MYSKPKAKLTTISSIQYAPLTIWQFSYARHITSLPFNSHPWKDGECALMEGTTFSELSSLGKAGLKSWRSSVKLCEIELFRGMKVATSRIMQSVSWPSWPVITHCKAMVLSGHLVSFAASFSLSRHHSLRIPPAFQQSNIQPAARCIYQNKQSNNIHSWYFQLTLLHYHFLLRY